VINAWIDELIPGQETTTLPAETDLAQTLGRLEIERDLPKLELPVFDGSPLMWPRLVEQFFIQAHSHSGLSDTRRMDLLQSHMKGNAERLIQELVYSGHNYALSLQEFLEFAFDHRVAIAMQGIRRSCNV